MAIVPLFFSPSATFYAFGDQGSNVNKLCKG